MSATVNNEATHAGPATRGLQHFRHHGLWSPGVRLFRARLLGNATRMNELPAGH